MQENATSNVNEYSSDGSGEDIKITLNPVDKSKIRCNFCGLCGHTGSRCETRKPEDNPIQFNCSFCFRGNKPERFYMSHIISECRFREKYNEGKKNFTSVSK